jgi:hypothetical protein
MHPAIGLPAAGVGKGRRTGTDGRRPDPGGRLHVGYHYFINLFSPAKKEKKQYNKKQSHKVFNVKLLDFTKTVAVPDIIIGNINITLHTLFLALSISVFPSE